MTDQVEMMEVTNTESNMKLYTISTSDNIEYKIPDNYVKQCGTLKNMLEDIPDTNDAIPLPNVNSKVMPYLMKYWEQHKDDPIAPPKEVEEKPQQKDTTMEPWDEAYANDFSETEEGKLALAQEVLLAANYLDCKALLELLCKRFALIIKGKTPEQIRLIFNIENDFTPEEEEQVRKENAWCEEK